MAEPLKSKRSGPLPMQRAIRAARINRRFDQLQEQMCRAIEALKPLPDVRATASADASRCPDCVEIKFIESDSATRVCSKGAGCISLEPASDAASFVKDLALADGANHTVVDSHDGAAAKNDSFPSGEAGLADVVSSLIDAQKKLARQVRLLKSSLEAEWESRGVDMSTLYHPAYDGIVRPKPLAVDCLGFPLPSSEVTGGSKSRFPEKSCESPPASIGCGGCCGCKSDPSRSRPLEAQTSSERATGLPKC